MTNRINKDFLITIMTVGIPVIMQLLFIRYVSYNVDKDIYGNFILLQTLITGLSYIFLRVPSQAYSRFYNTVSNRNYYINEFRTLLIFINILSFIAICIYGFIMQRFSYEVLFILFIYFIILNQYNLNQAIFLLNLERKKFFFLKLFEAIAKFIFPILLYMYFQTLESFLYGLLIGYIIAFLVLYRHLKSYPFKYTINIENLKKYFSFAYPVLFVSIFVWGISFSDRYFIDYYLETKDIAIYALLAQVAGMGQIVGQIYGLYVNPKIYKMYEEGKINAIKYLSKFLKILISIFVILGGMAYMMPTSIYELLLEPEIIRDDYYFKVFMILILGIFITVYNTALSMYLNLYKKLSMLAYMYAIAFVINIIGNLYIEDFGIVAASISTLVSYFVLSILLGIYLKVIHN